MALSEQKDNVHGQVSIFVQISFFDLVKRFILNESCLVSLSHSNLFDNWRGYRQFIFMIQLFRLEKIIGNNSKNGSKAFLTSHTYKHL